VSLFMVALIFSIRYLLMKDRWMLRQKSR